VSLNNGSNNKSLLRAELEKMVEAFEQDGGTVSRSAGSKITLRCTICGHRRHVSMAFALQFKPQCSRCGGEANAEG
jgi:hypothetical protein